MQIDFESERFIMRRITEDDVQDFFELDSDPEVHKYLGNEPVSSLHQSAKMINDVLAQYEKFGIGRSAIIDRETNDFIGWGGIKYETLPFNKMNGYHDIGYRLKQKYWGNGIATEVSIAALKYGFEELKLERICGGAEVGNIASNKILEKIGLTFINQFYIDDLLHNWFEIGAEEWEKIN
ncbi:GNAT family N-acetyltransferase [Paracrocinitomix mangrovi]|uniref:GNAT family N-acetyltransferase n=1 Tax=Paracrocinitomix mangrovi TaxID=2862509 RepID=UPI001C8D60EC|nr:GNAT family N-acetyltransferase [Paracrocinitomix mangrovi]UKN00665.1 GNAT family N-acetyltransferase [Paracrocinitomix mangrovi]